MRTLIVSGLGALEEYLYATAIALRGHPGAEVAFASRQALPDVLAERAGGGFREVLLLGMGLSTDQDRLAAAFAALRKAGAKIVWLSGGIQLPAGMPEATQKLFEASVGEDEDLPHWVAKVLGVDAGDLLTLHDGPARSSSAKAWQERFDAAGWSFANSRDFAPLESLARDLADRVPPDRWGDGTQRLIAAFHAFGYRRLETASPAMRRLRKDIGAVARSGVMRVLVTGESGVGKETVAQQIHVQSGRRGPFLAFNCATVAKELLESRLFGHAKGAFTGAVAASPGLFREADGGTLFLDEIAELPLETQGMLLRVLQEGRVQPVGETQEVKVDVRVVAATNRDLPELVRERRFREDLYFRLSLVELHVPALRERPEDLAPIAQNLWRAMTKGKKTLSDADMAALAGFDWPGNVRELGNVLERASIFRERTIPELVEEERRRSGRGGEKERADGTALARLRADGTGLATRRADGIALAELALAEDATLEAVVRAYVREVWERHGRNSSETARILGISRNTLRAKLEPVSSISPGS